MTADKSLEQIVEIDASVFLELISEALLDSIKNQEKIEESMIRYFADNHKYHIAHYLNVGSGELFYNNITEKENGETETQ